MIDDIFQQCDNPDLVENRHQEVVADAFASMKNLVPLTTGMNLALLIPGAKEVPEDGYIAKDGDSANFGLHVLEDAVHGLDTRAKSSKLAATILLLNLYTVHGMNNYFVDELFSILHSHILPENNSLPRNHYLAKILIQKLDLAYNTIHACKSGSILFQEEYANKKKNPKCNKPRFKDQDQ
jgi:hypothetical protein